MTSKDLELSLWERISRFLFFTLPRVKQDMAKQDVGRLAMQSCPVSYHWLRLAVKLAWLEKGQISIMSVDVKHSSGKWRQVIVFRKKPGGSMRLIVVFTDESVQDELYICHSYRIVQHVDADTLHEPHFSWPTAA